MPKIRGDTDFQSKCLLKTKLVLARDLSPQKNSEKLVVRKKSFTPYATFTDRPQTDHRQTDHRQLIGSGLGSVGPRIGALYLHQEDVCKGLKKIPS